jgi:hypothetical protein
VKMTTITSRYSGVATMLAVTLMAAPAIARPVFVTNNTDDQPGSFRDAIVEASSDPSVSSVLFVRGLEEVVLQSSVVYSGAQPLRIDGRGTSIAGDGEFDLLVSDAGGDLVLRKLTFTDGLNGVVVLVPDDAEGEVSTALLEVAIENNRAYGLLIDDETNGGSDAGVGLSILFSSVTNNGLNIDEGVIEDLDGVRVNERGNGDITASVLHSSFTMNGADGYELDEGGPGDVHLTVRGSTFDDNGTLEPGGDDGLDVDEADGGSIWLSVVGATFNRNSDDGIGVDESGPGDMRLSAVRVEASDTGDKGFSIDEVDEGNLLARAVLVTADRNVEDGLNFEEAGAGAFRVRVANSALRDNGEAGIEAAQEMPGAGMLALRNVMFQDNGDAPVDSANVDVVGGP